jgi:hypothetical protein
LNGYVNIDNQTASTQLETSTNGDFSINDTDTLNLAPFKFLADGTLLLPKRDNRKIKITDATENAETQAIIDYSVTQTDASNYGTSFTITVCGYEILTVSVLTVDGQKGNPSVAVNGTPIPYVNKQDVSPSKPEDSNVEDEPENSNEEDNDQLGEMFW